MTWFQRKRQNRLPDRRFQKFFILDIAIGDDENHIEFTSLVKGSNIIDINSLYYIIDIKNPVFEPVRKRKKNVNSKMNDTTATAFYNESIESSVMFEYRSKPKPCRVRQQLCLYYLLVCFQKLKLH